MWYTNEIYNINKLKAKNHTVFSVSEKLYLIKKINTYL